MQVISAAREKERKQTESDRARIVRAIEASTDTRFPACFVKLSDLHRMGRLASHEEMRDRHLLHMLDSHDALLRFVALHPTVFCSQ